MPYKDKELQRAYARAWIANRKASYFADKCCVECGSTGRLELDHIDPNQKVEHRIWSWSAERREVELSKCQVLCYDCHLVKSSKEKCKGENSPAHKLTEVQVKEIRELFARGGYSKRGLARIYNVDEYSIRAILAYKRWKHI